MTSKLNWYIYLLCFMVLIETSRKKTIFSNTLIILNYVQCTAMMHVLKVMMFESEFKMLPETFILYTINIDIKHVNTCIEFLYSSSESKLVFYIKNTQNDNYNRNYQNERHCYCQSGPKPWTTIYRSIK